jgi:hypothetical protein
MRANAIMDAEGEICRPVIFHKKTLSPHPVVRKNSIHHHATSFSKPYS